MRMQGVTLADFHNAVARVNDRYGYNLEVHPDAHESGSRRVTTVGRLTVKDSHEDGARFSWSGRHCKAACWHAFRDVIREVFVLDPSAVVKTSLARYTADNFEHVYPSTSAINIGSQFNPAYMPDLCVGPCAGTNR